MSDNTSHDAGGVSSPSAGVDQMIEAAREVAAHPEATEEELRDVIDSLNAALEMQADSASVERVEALESELEAVQARQDAFSKQLSTQKANLGAVAKKATYNAVTGGERKANRKQKVLAELHYRAEQEADGRVSLGRDDVEDIADVSARTARTYARELAEEVDGVWYTKPGEGWWQRGESKQLKMRLSAFESASDE